MTLFYWLFLLLVLSFFLPYNVDRPARRVPYVTYGLLAANALIFCWTIVIANAYLPGDQRYARQDIEQLLQTRRDQLSASHRKTLEAIERFEQAKQAGQVAADEVAELDAAARDRRQQFALEVVPGGMRTATGFQRIWRIQHAYDAVVWEPHYSAMNLFAYRVSELSPFKKVLGLLGSMFLHGSPMHLLGNLLYLWVFGRAIEDALGPYFTLATYLVCGVAATLMHHLITVLLAPGQAAVPLVGASGAIAGVLGLFALRFYRTPVRIFYVLPYTLPILAVATLLVGALLSLFTGSFATGMAPGFGVAVGLLIVFGRNWAWGHFRLASMWTIGVWIVLFNLIPALLELFAPDSGGGVAYWAHLGGFGCGMAYAALIGFGNEGAREYLLQDAQKEVSGGENDKALEHARLLLEKEPENAAAHEVVARAQDVQNNLEAAIEAYERAITLYLQQGQRVPAVSLYRAALVKLPRFVLPPARQFALASQMMKDADWQGAAENFYKIPFTYPDAPEGEVSLLRAAQLYGKYLDQPELVRHLTSTFLDRYPDSPWRDQARQMQAVANLNR